MEYMITLISGGNWEHYLGHRNEISERASDRGNLYEMRGEKLGASWKPGSDLGFVVVLRVMLCATLTPPLDRVDGAHIHVGRQGMGSGM
ncbi:hypothetical protein DSL72_006894 [Monilinia vaccinii-corymbosi]|uniref:Uncharacterized protein n=1 Tax=Monilinia vaccinii-corymbosi TaxID=61207 RepID=A0A8A3PK88_9HELO|nr:hypothetical protein DSL72_006894 [Monilinia vaccinii-corymbosi]